MNEMNVDWDDLRLFLAIARSGGMAAAANETGKSAPTLGRRMLALERQLGKDLFHRKARGYELTKDGMDFLENVAGVEAGLLPLIEVDNAPPVVKISAGSWVTQLLCRRVGELSNQGAVRLQFLSTEETLDIGRREALIGVRNHRPNGRGLAGRRIGRVQFAIYATDPSVATWAQVVSTTPSSKWVQSISTAKDVIEVTNPRNAVDLAVAGVARVILPTFAGDGIGELVRVSDLVTELEHDQWLVTHNEDRFISKVRQVIDRTYRVLREVCSASGN